MTPTEWPFLNVVLNAGTDDPVFQGLLFTGPAVIIAIILIGRSPFTTALAAGYLILLVGNTFLNGFQ